MAEHEAADDLQQQNQTAKKRRVEGRTHNLKILPTWGILILHTLWEGDSSRVEQQARHLIASPSRMILAAPVVVPARCHRDVRHGSGGAEDEPLVERERVAVDRFESMIWRNAPVFTLMHTGRIMAKPLPLRLKEDRIGTRPGLLHLNHHAVHAQDSGSRIRERYTWRSVLVFHIDALQGGKHRRRGKDKNDDDDDDERELVFREDGQEYAQVTEMLGSGRLEAQCFDGEKRLAHIRERWGKIKAYGELPENTKINETDVFGEEDGDCAFEFGDESEVDIDDI
ncbi:hypothetical protein EV421DRAFT_1732596 [Armillaria borealis]|uniref:S1-like domain-containing protein n=1 Tax=Armillaria borealis TaxID=47425 RepID=A0AA39JXL1_9AGAR|nr:hypothetical protein EV421DRAFT_1732596 [Armillaria borealis]